MVASHNSDSIRHYSTSLLSHEVPTEPQRLRLLERALDPDTIRILGELGLDPAWRCLELGAGAGSIAYWLAEHCANVVATDIDLTFLDSVRPPNLRVQKHDLVIEDSPGGTFDLIHARLLIEHLPERDALPAKIAGWLSPGGWLVIEAFAYFPLRSSPHPAMRRLCEAMENYLAMAIGTDTNWAPRLPILLGNTDLVELGMSVRTHLSTGPARAASRVTVAQVGPALIAHGLLTEAELAAGIALFDDPTYLDLSFAIISVWGRRPRA